MVFHYIIILFSDFNAVFIAHYILCFSLIDCLTE